VRITIQGAHESGSPLDNKAVGRWVRLSLSRYGNEVRHVTLRRVKPDEPARGFAWSVRVSGPRLGVITLQDWDLEEEKSLARIASRLDRAVARALNTAGEVDFGGGNIAERARPHTTHAAIPRAALAQHHEKDPRNRSGGKSG